MADDAHEERFRQHEALLEGLARILAAQHEKNQSYDTIIQEQRAMNQRLTAAIERIDDTLAQGAVTQARIETLLARMIPQSENGRDA
jgi:ABC-type transporter Mla subunit MlaD